MDFEITRTSVDGDSSGYACEYCGYVKPHINWCEMENTGTYSNSKRVGAQLCDLCASCLTDEAIKQIAHDEIHPYRNWTRKLG